MARKIGAIDVRRAFLYGKMEREVYIRLPDDDPMAKGGKYLGRLRKTLYGTRDAPLAWQRVVREFMEGLGFESCLLVSGTYVHRKRDLRIIAHVDDFMACGSSFDVHWFIDHMQNNYDIKHEILGFSKGDARAIKFLGRTVRCTPWGLSVGGDAKHARVLLEEWSMDDSRGVDTPYVHHDRNVDSPDMTPERATVFRRAVARLSYMSQDRADLCFASRALASCMARPKVDDEVTVKRALRYLRNYPVSVLHFPVQELASSIECMTDADWAGDQVTRRSTSGGVIRRGMHVIQLWSRLQARVAFSSCESEVNGLIKGAAEGLYHQRLAQFFGDSLSLELATDASAARAVLIRTGVGKMKHLSAKQLWVQELVAKGEVKINKIDRLTNFADALTHPWSKKDTRFFETMGFHTQDDDAP